MAESVPKEPGQSPLPPPVPPLKPASPSDRIQALGRYDANIQLIRRRLADQNRTGKAKWWWQSR